MSTGMWVGHARWNSLGKRLDAQPGRLPGCVDFEADMPPGHFCPDCRRKLGTYHYDLALCLFFGIYSRKFGGLCVGYGARAGRASP